MALTIAVAGTGEASAEVADLAERVGRRLGAAGAVLVCGGLGGVMEAACRGARGAGGLTVGLLPGLERDAANPFVTVALPTGMGEARNVLLVHAADALVAVGTGYGTLSEVAFALKAGKPVVGVGTWPVEGVVAVHDPEEAAALVLELAAGHSPGRGGSGSG